MPEPSITVRNTGPLFTSPPGTVREAVEDIVQETVELGEQRLDRMLRPRPGGVFLSVAQAGRGKASTGNYRRNVNARTDGLTGRLDDGGVVYGPWLEGTSSRNQSTRFKGYASFRRVADWLNKRKGRIIRKHAERLVRRLN